jgi:hypothetical protein
LRAVRDLVSIDAPRKEIEDGVAVLAEKLVYRHYSLLCLKYSLTSDKGRQKSPKNILFTYRPDKWGFPFDKTAYIKYDFFIPVYLSVS